MAHGTYLDYNATGPLLPAAKAAMTAAMEMHGNPSSVHAAGRAARTLVEEARASVARILSAAPAQVVFTAGGTEANALALGGMLAGGKAARVLVSAVEHPSVIEAVDGIETLPVDGSGRVVPEALEEALAAGGPAAVVSVMLANNETGAIQPVERLAEICRRYGAWLHCDAVQAIGRMPVTLAGLGAHLVTLSAHKIGGPKGVGALVVEDGVPLAGLTRGGGQERGIRAGTENLVGIAGFAAAADAALDREWIGRIAALRDDLERQAVEEVPQARVIAADVPRLANTSCLALPGVPAETQVMALDLAGVAVSAGSACSSGKVRRSHVLAAMGLADDLCGSAIRVSLGRDTLAEDAARFLSAWQGLARRVAERAA